MSKGLVFWLIMVLCLVLGIMAGWPGGSPGSQRAVFMNSIVVWILLFLLGWAVFGFVIQ